jgi:hypothetical protein
MVFTLRLFLIRGELAIGAMRHISLQSTRIQNVKKGIFFVWKVAEVFCSQSDLMFVISIFNGRKAVGGVFELLHGNVFALNEVK